MNSPTFLQPRFLIAGLVILATLLIYAQTGSHDFLVFDDDEYVTANPVVRDGLTLEGIQWAFTAFHSSNWHPLTWISHMLDCELFGLNAGAHHRVNVFLHLLNALLMFRVLTRMTGAVWRSGCVALLFAAHPLHIESVAWIAERKDLLSTLFGLLTLSAYAVYVGSRRRKTVYWTALVFYAASLMSKPMLVTLPCVMLLLDFWPLGRMTTGPAGRGAAVGYKELIAEKIPFFILAFLSCAITYRAQNTGASVVSAAGLPLAERLANAVNAYAGYIAKTLAPFPLAVFYPFERNLPAWQTAASAFVLIGITFLTVRRWRTHPYLPAGWFWYLGTLVPVIGLIQVGAQSMADRYMYIPMTGLLIMAVWGLSAWIHKQAGQSAWSKRLSAGAAAAAILAAILLSRHQVAFWKNSITLFSHTLQTTDNNYVAHVNLGSALARAGQYREAIAQCDRALEINPELTDALYNRGSAYYKIGRLREAAVSLEKAVTVYPQYAAAHNNLGLVYTALGQYEKAAAHLSKAVQLDPALADARANLGNVLFYQKRPMEALEHYNAALAIDPNHAGRHCNRGMVLESMGRWEEALVDYRNAIDLQPGNALAYRSAGITLFKLKRLEKAEEALMQAVELAPEDSPAHLYLGRIKAARGHMEAATAFLEEAVALNPSDADARYHLGVVLATRGRLQDAVDQFTETVGIMPGHIGARRNIVQACWLNGDYGRAYRELELLKTRNPGIAYQLFKWMQRHPGISAAQ